MLSGAESGSYTESEYRLAFRSRLDKAELFVQLLGPHATAKRFGWQQTSAQIEADEADLAASQRGLRILKWRPRDLPMDLISDEAYLSLLQGRHVQAVGIEEFKHSILMTLHDLAGARPPPRADSGQPPKSDLLIYDTADHVDSEVALKVSDSLERQGVSTLLAPEPTAGQTPGDIRLAQTESLQDCDGLILIYGQAPSTWVQSQFAFSRRVLTQKRPGAIWGALLDAPPPDKPAPPLRSPNLMMLDCRAGLDSELLARFLDALRQSGSGHHV